jgi:hypothetical protein
VPIRARETSAYIAEHATFTDRFTEDYVLAGRRPGSSQRHWANRIGIVTAMWHGGRPGPWLGPGDLDSGLPEVLSPAHASAGGGVTSVIVLPLQQHDPMGMFRSSAGFLNGACQTIRYDLARVRLQAWGDDTDDRYPKS